MINVTSGSATTLIGESEICDKEKSVVSRKTFVIDTNVLLHDPEAIIKFPNSDIVVPIAVLEELGSMKRLSDERGQNSRSVLRLLDSLKKKGTGDLHDGVFIENGARICVEMDPKTHLDPEDFPSLRHNKVLMPAFNRSKKGDRVVFVSKDLVSRVKAEAMGLEAEDYENLKFSYHNVCKGIQRLEVEKRVIDSFYKDNGVFLEGKFHTNEYLVLTSPEQSSAVCRWDSIQQRAVPLIKGPDNLWGVKPLNVEQRCSLDLLLRDDVKLVALIGQAGTGKTLMALASGMRKVFDEPVYNKILVSRPIMPLGKDIGYLPGTKEEKLSHWMQPIYDNLEFLCGNSSLEESSETMRWVLESKKIEMEAVTYIRGRSLPKMFIIIDEAQNLTPHEVKTIISRAGHGTKVILAGDPTQIDNPYLDKDSNGLTFAVGTFRDQKIFGSVFLDKTERSELAAIAAGLM
ncbi:MAG: PhoH-like ATPase [Chlamydiales bacterium]|jgi:PhoH-like ATPase